MTYQQYVDHVLADSPLLYWPLQGDGEDATANNRDGTVTTGGLWEDVLPTGCRGAQAFGIPTGNTGSQYLGYTGTLDTNAGNGLSVEFWLCPLAVFVGGGPRAFSDTGANKFEMTVSTATGSIRFSTSGSTGRITITDGAVPLGRWAYWVFTQDSAGSSRVYKNGALVGGPTTQTVGADFPDFKLSNGGQTTTASRWQHVAVHNTVLSASRISDRFAIQAEDLYSFQANDYMPADFNTTVLVPAVGAVTAPVIQQGQLWPRGNPPG